MTKRNIIKVHKNSINAKLRHGGIWEGYIVGNKVNQSNYLDNWGLAIPVVFRTLEEMNNTLNAFCASLPPEFGNRPVFFICK